MMDADQLANELLESVGGSMVGLSWSPSETEKVCEIKRRTAELINLCDEVKVKLPPDAPAELLIPPRQWLPEERILESECHRLAERAKSAYEEAAMWGVRLAWLAKHARRAHSRWLPHS